MFACIGTLPKNRWYPPKELPKKKKVIAEAVIYSIIFLFTNFEINQTKVSVMAQGTSKEASWGIAEGGFGVVASANDQGWFGKGFSFLFLFFFSFSKK